MPRISPLHTELLAHMHARRVTMPLSWPMDRLGQARPTPWQAGWASTAEKRRVSDLGAGLWDRRFGAPGQERDLYAHTTLGYILAV